jgi:lysophospholipase L1-like esterase
MPITFPGVVARPYLYVPDGWDDAWRAAKAASASAFASIAFLGDSFTMGYACSNYLTKSFRGLIRAALIARGYGVGGDFYNCYESVDGDVSYTGTPPWVVTTTSRTWLAWGFGRLLSYTGGAGVGVATLTTPYACTEIDLLWYDHTGSGTGWRYAVDGGATTNVATNGNKQNKRVVITGLANTAHTVVCDNPSASNTMLLHGAAIYPTAAARAAGIGYGNLGLTGLSLGQLGLMGAGITDFLRQFAGWAGAGTANTGYGFPTGPALTIVALGINDCQNMYGIDGFMGQLRRLIQALRQATPNASVLIVAQCNPDQLNSDVTSNRFDNSNSWHLYCEAMSSVARSFRCAFVNMHAKWGETPVGQGFSTSASQAHPTDAGMADIAQTILAVI